MAVSREETKKIAKLAQLSFSEEELDKITRDLNEILEYMSSLNQIDTQNIQPLAHPIENIPRMREDVVHASVPRGKSLQNAPQANEEYFLVPKVIK
ncbi:MAG: Asp-tRNA(Asn)/Glu-tRNA(Gln) amidotransferase subunit GatC [Ignavibacteriales bacterium]|nr:Asp-tRNA(Asn)/Glu-tRNA(Gln) amidotransferase subunit GatC [Ignavibacteriales bacterium]